MARLFAQEVPETATVSSKFAPGRDPGSRQDRVISKDSRSIRVGPGVGMRGVRVQAVVQNCRRAYRHHSLEWRSGHLHRECLPCRCEQSRAGRETRRRAGVPDDQPLAIGRRARMCASVSAHRWQIDILTEQEEWNAGRRNLPSAPSSS
jgi:transcription antitermination factor NusA-like protein